MGETCKYFVPHNEVDVIGRAMEIAGRFWALGIFLATPHDFISNRIREWKAAGRPLPKSRHDFSFGEIGLGGSTVGEPVPNLIYDIACPGCTFGLLDQVGDVWEDEVSSVPTAERPVTCPSCKTVSLSRDLLAPETPFTFSRFYLWVADIEPDDWDESFKETVESVLGPCEEFTSWET